MNPYEDLDARLHALAEELHPDLASRLRALIAADGAAHEIIELRQRTQRAEDLARECQRQYAARDRQVDRLSEELAAALRRAEASEAEASNLSHDCDRRGERLWRLAAKAGHTPGAGDNDATAELYIEQALTEALTAAAADPRTFDRFRPWGDGTPGVTEANPGEPASHAGRPALTVADG